MNRPRASTLFSALSLTAILALTLRPTGNRSPAVALCMICGDRATVDMLLNVALFAPFGFALALSRTHPHTLRVGLVTLGISLGIELLQLVIPGRTVSAADVLLNTLGGALGAFLSPRRAIFLRPVPTTGLRLGLAGGIAWIGVLTATAAALQPMLQSMPLYTQIKPSIPTPSYQFNGEVFNVRIGDVGLMAGPITDSVRLRSALDTKIGELSAHVVRGATSTARTSIIARVVDERRRTRLELRQTGASLVFEPGLRAAVFRLTRPAIRLNDVFLRGPNARCGDDPIRASGGVDGGTLYVSVENRACRAREEIGLRATLGWSLLIPMTYAYGSEAPWLTAIWLVVPVLIFSYWLGRALRCHARAVATSGAGILLVGLCAVPAWFALPRTVGWEWLAAIGAMVIGLGIGRATSEPRNSAS